MDSIVHGVAKNGTRLSDFFTSTFFKVLFHCFNMTFITNKTKSLSCVFSCWLDYLWDELHISYHLGQAGYIVSRLTFPAIAGIILFNSQLCFLPLFVFFSAALGTVATCMLSLLLRVGLGLAVGPGLSLHWLPGSLTMVTSRVAELGLSLWHAGLVAWWRVESFKTRDQTWVSFIGRYILNHLDHQGSPYLYIYI